MTMSDPLPQLLAFLNDVGIPTAERELDATTFLPGLTIDGGTILYDPARLLYPGDLLHEAGHVAITAAADRRQLSPTSPFTLGDDLAAIAWSWAALTYLRIDPAIVFHDAGYVGNARAYIENFQARRFVGVPVLEWLELTSMSSFPAMFKWLRD